MSNTAGSTGQPICVLFAEAIGWIADRNFAGAVAIGPRPLRLLPFDEDDEEYRILEGRCMLAQQLLIDHAAKGRIRIYAGRGWPEEQEDEDDAFPLQLATDFLKRAEHEFDPHGGHILFVPEEQGYNDLAVDYGDLIDDFWGDVAPSTTIREPTARPDRGTVPLRRRGRRPRYPWPDFAAE